MFKHCTFTVRNGKLWHSYGISHSLPCAKPFTDIIFLCCGHRRWFVMIFLYFSQVFLSTVQFHLQFVTPVPRSLLITSRSVFRMHALVSLFRVQSRSTSAMSRRPSTPKFSSSPATRSCVTSARRSCANSRCVTSTRRCSL